MTKSASVNNASVIPNEVFSKIYLIREQKMMLNSDLAALYGVPTFRLNEQVKRNRNRSPEDIMFQLTDEEWQSLTSQIAVSKKGRGRTCKNIY
ncbi:ORF6N domain-containing protein [Olivibacter domesticus]|uniref:ORF6N domain-containing protein n=1 Tax=Olivibacter domesticus TaxID=407022 RepID=A0A1H7K3Z8_OLID1|nr:ORF6N domain-containing protein [Olivibacter domesticus]SEK80615.1 ORF6N domain-containing protein [Olivibacter domesticus]